MTLITPRLTLVPFAPAHLLALIDDTGDFAASFGLPMAEGLGASLRSGEVSPAFVERLRRSTTPDPWLHGFAIVGLEAEAVIGTAGFKGGPDEDGVVEVAYGIAPAYQGRGYATDAAAALVRFASDDRRVRVVRAHTQPTTNASARVLAKCGFSFVGAVTDPEDGLVWRWDRAPAR